MPESTGAPCSIGKRFHAFPLHFLIFRNDHLGYALPIVYYLLLTRQVYYRHHYFPTVITVYSTGRVNECKALFYRQPTPWPYLHFKPLRYSKKQAGGY